MGFDGLARAISFSIILFFIYLIKQFKFKPLSDRDMRLKMEKNETPDSEISSLWRKPK